MTVSELIKELQKYDGDLTVWSYDPYPDGLYPPKDGYEEGPVNAVDPVYHQGSITAIWVSHEADKQQENI